jgi:hypothetical protein
VRLRKTSLLVPLLSLPLATGAAIVLPAAVPAAADSPADCATKIVNHVQIPQDTLSEWSTEHACVKWYLQYYLDLGPYYAGLAQDGIFGRNTLAAVKHYQAGHGGCTHRYDGVADNQTMWCLIHGTG